MRKVLVLLTCSWFSSLPALAQTSAWGKGNFLGGDFISFRKGIRTSDIDEEATFGTVEECYRRKNKKYIFLRTFKSECSRNISNQKWIHVMMRLIDKI